MLSFSQPLAIGTCEAVASRTSPRDASGSVWCKLPPRGKLEILAKACGAKDGSYVLELLALRSLSTAVRTKVCAMVSVAD